MITDLNHSIDAPVAHTPTTDQIPAEVLARLQRLYADGFVGETPDIRAKALMHNHDCPQTNDFVFASAPGRVELAGNHTDHQGGHTISAAIDLRIYALAAANGKDEVCVVMDNFGKAVIKLSDLIPRPEERGKSVSLIRGMLAAYTKASGPITGLNIAICTNLPVGTGVSSSAAFEVLLGGIIRAHHHNQKAWRADELTKIALEGVWAEQKYFGKPCGAQDQLASAHGGILALDFCNQLPVVEPIPFDMENSGYSLCLIDSLCDHSRFTSEFATIPTDMHKIAVYFNCDRLADVPYRQFMSHLNELRLQLGDRAVLRAMHFFTEDDRVKSQIEALRSNDFLSFLASFKESGLSSSQWLQNISPHADTRKFEQPAMMILALCELLLHNKGADVAGGSCTAGWAGANVGAKTITGAYRIHGGGFGGGILALVPNDDVTGFVDSMNGALGYAACKLLTISNTGLITTRLK